MLNLSSDTSTSTATKDDEEEIIWLGCASDSGRLVSQQMDDGLPQWAARKSVSK